MGRRWGKSVLGGAISIATSAKGGKVAWITPTYKNTRPLWRTIESTLAPLEKAGLCIIRRAERTVEFKNSGFLGLYSADNPTSILGEWFHVVVVDEAARIGETVWTDTIQPTLADAGGDAILISTPKGKNWFYQEWVAGQAALQQDPHTTEIASWIAPSFDNPNPRIKEAYKKAKTKVSARTFKQEWQAQFIDDGGVVFRINEDSKKAIKQEKAIPGHMYVVGVDTARTTDFTVITVIDLTLRELVYIDRFNQVEYALQIQRIKGINAKFNPVAIIIEQNNAHAVIEQLQRENLPIQTFVTTNATKAKAVDDLALAFELGDLKILPDPVLIAELEAFEGEKLPSGLIRYAAPDGQHDDCVMSLLINWQGCQEFDRKEKLLISDHSNFNANFSRPSIANY